MKMKILTIMLTFVVPTLMMASGHPHLYVSDGDRDAILQKIDNHDWARSSFANLKNRIDPYADRHQSDPQWIVSRLAMYWKDGEHYTQCYLKNQNWDRGEGNAPVPTVRMPGMRIWNKYSNVPLEERIPYNETGDMWGMDRARPSSRVLVPYKESGHMIRGNNVEILILAEEAAFLYWLTKEEKYAVFASDIFNTWLVGTYYMNPILDPECSSGGPGGYEPGGICGYYDYEQIHDDLVMHAAVIYDFAHDYIVGHPHSHLKEVDKNVEEVTFEVFRRFVEIGLVRGGRSGNWNVNGWNMILRPMLLLGEQKYLDNLVSVSSEYHLAIPDILKEYDSQTGLWPESPGYSFSVINMLMEFSTLLTRYGLDVIEDNPMFHKAAMAVFPWMDERGNLIVFGDYRGGPANFNSFEHFLAYYMKKGDMENAMNIAAALKSGIESGAYQRDRSGWVGLCTFVEELPTVTDTRVIAEQTYSPHHRLATMRGKELMALLYGGRNGYHLSSNGLALQLYGFGYALAPDASGYVSYWSPDMHYHQSVTGSNTILPGYAEGEVDYREIKSGVQGVIACEMTASEKKRTVVMVETEPGTGYYLDIFRSDQSDNDYLFHNVGRSVEFMNLDGEELAMTPTAGFDVKHHPAYDYFKNVSYVRHDKPFKAVWQVTDCMTMHMWMTGNVARTLYKMDAPHTSLINGITPENVSVAPDTTPSIIVRQELRNAWDRPYVAVFEPCRSEGPSVVSVEETLFSRDEVVLSVKHKSGRIDNIHYCKGKLTYTMDEKLEINKVPVQ